MPAEYVFAPNDKPIGNLPLPTSVGTGPTILGQEWRGFKRGDMPMVEGRNRIIDEDGWKVLETELRDTDRGGYGGNCRNEFWLGDNAEGGIYMPGQTVSCAFAFKLPVGFPLPPGWNTIWQIHTPWDYGKVAPAYASPMTLIALEGGKIRFQNDAEGGDDYMCDFEFGKWHVWGVSVLFGRPGHLRVWHGVDEIPSSPVVDKDRNTCIPNHSTATGEYTKNGFYRSVATEGKIHVHRRDAYAETPNGIDRAFEMFEQHCRPALLGSAPPPVNETLAALEREWAVFLEDKPGPRGQWTQDQRWRADNPGELAKLVAYRAGGTKPALTSEPGRRMVEHLTAWRVEKGLAP